MPAITWFCKVISFRWEYAHMNSGGTHRNTHFLSLFWHLWKTLKDLILSFLDAIGFTDLWIRLDTFLELMWFFFFRHKIVGHRHFRRPIICIHKWITFVITVLDCLIALIFYILLVIFVAQHFFLHNNGRLASKSPPLRQCIQFPIFMALQLLPDSFSLLQCRVVFLSYLALGDVTPLCMPIEVLCPGSWTAIIDYWNAQLWLSVHNWVKTCLLCYKTFPDSTIKGFTLILL